MAQFAAFLRAVNVGGTGMLPMRELRTLCEGLGFNDVQTHIASGNVVFETNQPRSKIVAALQAKLAAHMGKTVGIFVRDADELGSIVSADAFPSAGGNRLMVMLLGDEPQRHMLDAAKNVQDEQMALGPKCLYVHYPSGMGRSKLKIPGAEHGTARNMNTIRKVLEMMGG